MAKYLSLENGRTKEVAALESSGGAADAGKIPQLDAAGKLSETMMPDGIGADLRARTASEALSASELINVFDDAGTVKIRKADATAAGKEVDGFVLSAIASGASGDVYFEGTVSGLSGLTPGARYYLDTTAGGITATAPTGAGNVVQYVGRAISATELSFEPADGIILAS